MSERPIAVGDLVVVVRKCCDELDINPLIFVVGEEGKSCLLYTSDAADE